MRKISFVKSFFKFLFFKVRRWIQLNAGGKLSELQLHSGYWNAWILLCPEMIFRTTRLLFRRDGTLFLICEIHYFTRICDFDTKSSISIDINRQLFALVLKKFRLYIL
jgi:hypothetical protein